MNKTWGKLYGLNKSKTNRDDLNKPRKLTGIIMNCPTDGPVDTYNSRNEGKQIKRCSECGKALYS